MNALVFNPSLRPVTLPTAGLAGIIWGGSLPDVQYAGGQLRGIAIPVFPAVLDADFIAMNGDFVTMNGERITF